MSHTLPWIAVTAGVGAVLWIGFVAAFRTKFRPVQDRIRRFNRDVTNPRQLRQAGRPGAWASVVNHTGRRTGTAYRTPVVAVPSDGGFVFALPYGPDVDWVRNLRAGGTATLEHEGRTVTLHQPTFLIGHEADRLFPAKEQRMHRTFGVRDFLRVEVADATTSAVPSA